MKIILKLLFLLVTTQVFSQTDHNGNPVFNSISTGEETIKDFGFVSNYYTLKNNIENKGSSVYISDNPTLAEIENAAVNLPSDFFIIKQNQAISSMIMILNKPTRQYFIINMATGKRDQLACDIIGDITENRANEIIKEKYDSKAKIAGNTLFFNNKELVIISNKEIKEKILQLIEKQKLNDGATSNFKVLSKDELRNMILTESKVGGKLDFFTEIAGHEYDGIQVKPGVFSTKIGIALYKWGRANFTLGINTLEDTLEFWKEFKGREANENEKSYIKMGFNKELEK